MAQDEHDHGEPALPPALRRRELLLTAVALALGAAVPAGEAAAIERGLPFDDGTYFDDGTGWVD